MQPWQIINGTFDPYATRPNPAVNNQITDLQSQISKLNQQLAMRQTPPPINYQPSQQWQTQLSQAQNRPSFQGLLNGYTPRQAPTPQASTYQGFNAAPINSSALASQYLGKGK